MSAQDTSAQDTSGQDTSGQDTSGQREAVDRLVEVKNRFIRQFVSAPLDRWNFSPGPGHRSMAEVCEHLALSHERIGKLLAIRVPETRLEPGSADVQHDEIPYLFYRGDEPPDIARPAGRRPARVEGINAFVASIEPAISWAETTTIDLHSHGSRHPVSGMLDGVQWLIFAGAHTERHRAQLIGLSVR